MKFFLRSLFFVLFIKVLTCEAKVIYVNESASGLNNGVSWTNAFKRLQDAIAASAAGDEIWIAAGNYKPIYVASPSVNDRMVSFNVPNNVKLYGGFSGTETNLSQRDWTTNLSVLDGNIGSPTGSGDNSHNVLKAINTAAGTLLDGLRIVNGYSSGSLSSGTGGGILISNSNLTISNCTFTSNYAASSGGAIYVTSGNSVLNLNDCKIVGNSCPNSIVSVSNIFRATRCDFSDNQGGSVISPSFDSYFDRCIFSGNSVTESILSDGVYAYNCLFVGNVASVSIMDVYYSTSAPTFEMWNCTVAHNKITNTNNDFNFVLGGGVFGSTVFRNNIVWGNIVNRPFYYNTSENVAHCLIQGGYTGTSNLSSDPKFVLPGNAALAPFNAKNYNYTLQPNSPALNTGNNNFVKQIYNLDLNDSARISAITVDMGCYEKQYCSANVSISTSGPTSFCSGGFVNLTVPQSGTYSWSNGASSPSIATSASGNYSVTVIDPNGCFGTASQQVTVFPASVQITGNTTLCNGLSTTLTATSPDGNIFSWSSGTNGASITTAQPGFYTVTVTTNNSCTATASATLTAQTVNQPFITISNNILSSTPASGYQWFWNGNLIQGATSQTHLPLQNGNYYVVTTENGCQSANSNTITVLNVGVENLSNVKLSIVPNPAANQFFIQSENLNGIDVSICDVSGRVIQSKSLERLNMPVDITMLPNGFYLVKIEDGINQQYLKLQVSK
jgi:predicted outer membrane repeat protein